MNLQASYPTAHHRCAAEAVVEFFGRRALPGQVDDYVLSKYQKHVERDFEWPDDTTPEEYLASLRETVVDWSSAIYLTNTSE